MRKISWCMLGVASFFLAGCSATEDAVSVSSDAHDVSEKGIDGAANKGALADLFEAEVKAKGDDRAHFDFDRSSIRPDAAAHLDAQAAWLAENPEAHLLIEGRCDSRGPLNYNMGLGERRAMAVKAYLVQKGINPDRIKTMSHGNQNLLYEGDTPDVHQKNRVGLTLVR